MFSAAGQQPAQKPTCGLVGEGLQGSNKEVREGGVGLLPHLGVEVVGHLLQHAQRLLYVWSIHCPRCSAYSPKACVADAFSSSMPAANENSGGKRQYMSLILAHVPAVVVLYTLGATLLLWVCAVRQFNGCHSRHATSSNQHSFGVKCLVQHKQYLASA